ncbi:hypothetical protein B1R94_10215 [Mycolicibacterium litorale]|nr:hypothetical protein B1R94_10215 [Mycolicibacterium litorale]
MLKASILAGCDLFQPVVETGQGIALRVVRIGDTNLDFLAEDGDTGVGFAGVEALLLFVVADLSTIAGCPLSIGFALRQ